ncbi:lipopolysaccharide kinase InaA family protein [bacterium]|nr:lipopolysaccharide kinase InaA family protein [bacterium]
MEGVTISPEFAEWFPDVSFDGVAAQFPLALEEHRKRTLVCKETLTNPAGQALTVYFKVYASRKRALDGFARRSRALCEAANLDRFDAWGIRTPGVVARGYRRRVGGLCADQSFIITRAADAEALVDWWTSKKLPASAEVRDGIIKELAGQTRVLHKQRFFHQDLKWRNLLVNEAYQLWWIDCPSGHFGRFPWRLTHGRMKDLATLDILGKDRCTPEERRLFLSVYLGTQDEGILERWARMVVNYCEKRFR